MARFFSFGCSFTEYFWPTWADIIGKSFTYFDNWGACGGGNQFIYSSLIECHLKENITNDDTVIIMWTSTGREDRYVKGRWLHIGNIYNAEAYTPEFIEKFTSERGYIIRDLALIYGAKKILDSIGCKYTFLSMLPLTYVDGDNGTDQIENVVDIVPYYQEVLNIIRPSVYEVIFNYDWCSRPFIAKNHDPFWQKWYNTIKDVSWPEWQGKINFQLFPEPIIKECREMFGFHVKSRDDIHPTPLEHLEYLDTVLPEITITDDTRTWVKEIDQKVRAHKWDADKWTTTKRITRW